MATTKTKAGAKPAGGKGGKTAGGKSAGGKSAGGKADAPQKARGVNLPTEAEPKSSIGTPRLKAIYDTTVRAKLQRDFALANPHMVPKVVKVVLNVGMGQASKNARALDSAVEELMLITGQKPVITRAKKSIANFGLREGVPVGASVTLRGARMWEFLDRFIALSVPRIRDFKGLPNRSFDGRGNYTFGIKEQMIFPEIDYDKVEVIHGMDITIVTSAGRDDLAMALLKELGWPFRGETPVRVA